MNTTETSAEQETFESVRGRVEYMTFLPSQLVVDPFNHRQGNTAPPTQSLVDSVALQGVTEAVGVRPLPDGTFGVFKGRRRLLAAQHVAAKAAAKGIAEESLPPIPALVYHDLADADDSTLLLSLVENQFRSNATRADELKVAEQLAFMDVPERARRRHARVLGVSAAELAAAQTAAQLGEESKARALQYDFDWVEMSDWHSVGGDSGTFNRLREAKVRDARSGKPGNGEWRQTIQAIRDEQAEEAKLEAAKESLREQGVTIVGHSSTWLYGKAQPLANLLTSLGKPMTESLHSQTCPSHGAAVDPETLATVWVCTDWHAEGHRLTAEKAEELDRRNLMPVDPEEEKRAAKERRAGNLAWRSARTVRLEWLAAAIARKKLPEAAEELTERTVMGHAWWWSKAVANGRAEVTATLLGVPDPNEGRSPWERPTDPFEELIGRSPKSRRMNRMFARVAAAMERHVMADSAWHELPDEMVTWLRFLEEEFDYTLAACEREAIAAHEAKAAEKAAKAARSGSDEDDEEWDED